MNNTQDGQNIFLTKIIHRKLMKCKHQKEKNSAE